MSIKAKIELDNSELKNGLKDAENTAKSTMKNIKNTAEGVGGTMSKIGSAATSAANAMKGGFSGVIGVLSKIGPIGVAVAGTLALIGTAVAGVFNVVGKLTTKLDGIAKASKSVNMSTSAYQALQHACNRAGVSMESMLTIITKIDSAISHAADGEKKYREMFYALGLSWRDLESLSPEKQIMAVTDAIGKLNAEGKRLPAEVYNVFGRKGVQELNKASKEDFSKLIAEAGALGYVIDESAFRNAEAYRDAVSDTHMKYLKVVSDIEEALSLSEKLTKVQEKINKRIGVNGRVRKEYADTFEGVVDVGERIIKDKKNLTLEQKKSLLSDLYGQYIPDPTEKGSVNLLKDLNEDEITRAFDYAVRNIHWEQDLDYKVVKAIAGVVEKADKRFKKDDENTWMQRIQKSAIDEMTSVNISKVKDKADDLNRELIRSAEYYDKLNNRASKLVDIDKEILKIEKELSQVSNGRITELDAEVKHMMRKNAAINNQKAVINEINNLQAASDKSFNSFYSSMLGKKGANKEAIDQLFTSLESFGIKDQRNNLLKSINFQIFKDNLGQRKGESNADYTQRALNASNKAFSFDSIQNLLRKNPDMFFKAFQDIANDVSKNNIFSSLSEDAKKEMKRAQDVYNYFAETFELEPINIDLNLDTSDIDELMKTKDQVDAAAKAVAQFNLEQEAALAENAKELHAYEEELKSLNEEIGKIGSPNFANTKRKSELEALIKSVKEDSKQLAEQRDDVEIAIQRLQKHLMLPTVVAQVRRNNAENELKKEIEQKDAFRDTVAESKNEMNLIVAQTKRRQDIIDLLEKQNILKKAGIAVTRDNLKLYEKELNAIIRVNKEIGAAKLQKDLFGKTQDNAVNALKNVGLDRHAERLQMRISAEQTKGSPLNEYEKNLVDRLANITSKINNFSMPESLDNRIMTNELAAKGGFSKSVAVDKRDNSAAQLRALKEMQKMFIENNDIQKEIKSALIN